MHTTRFPVRSQQAVVPPVSTGQSALSARHRNTHDTLATNATYGRATSIVSEPSSISNITDNVLINSQVFDTESSRSTETREVSSVALTADSNVISQLDSGESDDVSQVTRPPASSQRSLDQEWIVFSPRPDEDEQDPASTPAARGRTAPLSFPAHNGAGSFLDQLNAPELGGPSQSATLPSLSTATADRINAWRINQSQHILNEFYKLEKRNRRKSQSASSSSGTTSSSEVDSKISSWGLPEEEDDEDYMMHTHNRIAAALSGSFFTSPETMSSQSALAISIISEELSNILRSDTPYDAALRLLLTAAEHAHQTYHQDALDQALSAILDPTLSLQSPNCSSQPFSSTGANTPTPATMAASARSSKNNESLWEYIKNKVLYDFIGLNDEILEVILGERFIDPDAKSESLSSIVSQGIIECRQSGSYADYGQYMSTPTPSPPDKSYMKMLKSTTTTTSATSPPPADRRHQSKVKLSQDLASVLRKRQRTIRQSNQANTSSESHISHNNSHIHAHSHPVSAAKAMAMREILQSRLLADLQGQTATTSTLDQSSQQQQHLLDDTAVSVSSSKRTAGEAAVPRSQTSAKRVRCQQQQQQRGSAQPSETGESSSNYWEMSSASGTGSETGNLIGVW